MPGYSQPVDIAQKGLNGRKAMEMSLNIDAPPNAADLPRGVALSQEQQVARILTNLRRLPDDLDKYVALNALADAPHAFALLRAPQAARRSLNPQFLL